MSEITPIQWCDSTVNPIMGCAGCELFPKPATILHSVDDKVLKVYPDWVEGHARQIYTELVKTAYEAIAEPSVHHHNELTTTNLYHFRDQFVEKVKKEYSPEAAEAARSAIAQQVTCYAAKLCMNKGYSLLAPERKPNDGYPANFEELKTYPDRMSDAAKMSDLLGRKNDCTPWKERLPRMIFVSDMGDAFSSQNHFDFLEAHAIPAIKSGDGQRHAWLWLTKRPHLMAEFGERIGGFPENVCVMTTLTSGDRSNQKRLADLKKVNASVRGLSIEPLWSDIVAEGLDLEGINWVVVGGESGSADDTRGFHLEWATKLRDHCREHGVAFFLKQFGRKPFLKGQPLKLKDPHGGDWSEWSEEFRVREFPAYFHEFRKGERVDWEEPRPAYQEQSKGARDRKLNSEEKTLLEKLEETVREGALKFMEVGNALAEIKLKRLYREGYKNFSEYCDQTLGISRQHANRLAKVSEIKKHVDPVLKKYGLAEATSERHLREYGRLKRDEDLIAVVKGLAESCDDDKAGKKNVSLKSLEKSVADRLQAMSKKTEDPEKESLETEVEEGEAVADAVLPSAASTPVGSLESTLDEALRLVREGDEESAIELLTEAMEQYRKQAA